MQKNSNRKGLALGATFALLASLFAAAPAQAAAVDGANIGAYPAAGTTFAGTLVEDFPVYVQLKPGNTYTNFGSDLVFKVEKTAGTNMDVMISSSAAVWDMTGSTTGSPSVSDIVAGSTSATVSGIANGGGAAFLNFAAHSTSDVVSWSPVTLKVTAWLDAQGGAKNDIVDSDEWFTTFTVTLANPNALTGAVTLTAPNEGDTVVTVSAKVTSALNFANLSGNFFLAMSSSSVLYTAGTASVLEGTDLSAATVGLRAGIVSESFTVASISASQSVSAALRYVVGASGSIYDGYQVGATSKLGAAAKSITALTSTVLKSANSTASGQAAAVRANQTYTIRVHAATNSVSVSGVAVSVALSGATLADGSKMISVNGAAATSSYPTALALTTGADGYATFTLATSGFASGDVVNVDAKSGNTAASQLVLTATTPAYSIVNDYDLYVTTPGNAVTLTYAVEDQWQVASALTTQRIKVTRGGTGFAYAETVSTVAVVGGAASFAFTPSPATKTGSATVTAVLERFDSALNAWVSGGSSDGTVTVNVTSVTDAHSVAPAVSFSASVSYFPSTTSFETVTGSVKNAGATVVVTGDASALVFRAAADKATASGTVTVRADANGSYTFQVASLKSGEFDISINVGGSVTTSKMVVDPVSDDAGKSITFDTTTIAAGSTKVITGTLVDMNGNPVNTSGSATILVTYVPTGNAGIPIGTMPTETDKDGKFSFTVLTGPNDKGTAVVTAAYYKSGAATAVKDVLSFTQNITVGASATETPAADQKLTVGSFKGYVAIYTKNYTGSKLSAKVAGKWLVVNNLSSFTRTVRLTGAGYTIKVDLYIDGSFVRSETVVTK